MSPTLVYWTDPTSAGGNPNHCRCADCGEMWDIPYQAVVVHECNPGSGVENARRTGDSASSPEAVSE